MNVQDVLISESPVLYSIVLEVLIDGIPSGPIKIARSKCTGCSHSIMMMTVLCCIMTVVFCIWYVDESLWHADHVLLSVFLQDDTYTDSYISTIGVDFVSFFFVDFISFFVDFIS